MESHALVVGVDRYDPVIGKLDSAVSDALGFAAWVTRAGGVPPANLRLLLESDPEGAPPVLPAGVAGFAPVSSRGIRVAIEALRQALPAQGGERLYVYYAGHGASILNWQDDPFLIPPDFVDPSLDAHLLLGFKELFNRFGTQRFEEQIFLIDACRDFALPGYERVIPSGARPKLAERTTRQYVLYSVAPGQRAEEAAGGGVWTGALLEALEGREYRPVTPGDTRERPFEIRLANLADWLHDEVEERIRNKHLKNAAQYLQTPEYDRDRQGGDPRMASFTEETVPKARLRVFVDPALAHRACKVSVVRYVPGLGEFVAGQVSSSPELPVPVDFKNLFPVSYSVRAEAERFNAGNQAWSLPDPPVVRLTLQAAPAPEEEFLGAAAVTRGEALEEVYRGPRRGGPLSYDVPVTGPEGSGTLVVTSPDASVWIEVLDARREVVHQGAGSFELADLQPGIYRVRLSLPGAAPSEETVEVRPGAKTPVRPSPPPTRLGAVVVDRLRGLGIGIERRDGAVDFIHPSEALGPVAGARLASLLAFASCAAQRPETGVLERLRSIGVRQVTAASSGLLVLVGSGADESEAELASFLAECRLDLRFRGGRSVELRDFEPLPCLPAAAQQSLEVPETGVLTAELRLPGMARTRYAVAILPERLTVFIAVAEADGTVEVQQYLLRLPGRSGSMSPQDAIRGVRRLGLAQSFYAAGRPEAALAASGPLLEELLKGHWIEPLLGCLAGYGLVRIGQEERFAGEALPGLLRSFPDLPDLHVLAGLCEAPERRGEHFAEALRRGRPIFAQGLRALEDGIPEKSPLLAEALASLVQGSPWTAWIARAPW